MSITQHQVQLRQILSEHSRVPVVALQSLEQVPALMEKLKAQGIYLAEITLRTACALDAIRLVKADYPEFIVAAGTVLETTHLKAAHSAGADFIVTPGFSPELTQASVDLDIPLLPGVMTPSEVLQARLLGHSVMKLFPAQSAGGIALLKDLAGPFGDVSFCPTGGIQVEDMDAFMALPNVIAVGASWLGRVS